jgi:hypothetical protein
MFGNAKRIEEAKNIDVSKININEDQLYSNKF